MRPSPVLLQKLARSRLVARGVVASVGVGERRSRAKGAGLEFTDHRAYRPGDDPRHLDPHLFARLGEPFVRQYEVHRQLPVTVLVDASASMGHGQPRKLDVAKALAATLGFVGLAGGDLVQAAVHADGRLRWSGRMQGAQRVDALTAFLDTAFACAGSFAGALRALRSQLGAKGLVFVIGDWWLDDPETELACMAGSGHELVAVQVLSPDEIDPSRLGTGEFRLVDAETGHELEISLDPETLDRHRRLLQAWNERLSTALGRLGGRLLSVRTDTPLERIVMNDWRKTGVFV